MKKDHIKLDIFTERPIVRNDSTSELDIVIEIRSNQSIDEIDRNKALNLCIVIDRSGSMSGYKLETAKKSCIDIFNQLGEKDLFTVVVFDHEAEVVFNPQVPKAEVVEQINKIQSRGMTNLSLGWYLGLLELQTYMTENHNSRLILLSDGLANQGETKVTTLGKEASKSRDLGITTSTIGIGEEFQEDILSAIATESGGRFWYIKESRIEDIIKEEFKDVLSVIIDRPRIELKLPTGVEVSKTKLNNLNTIGGKYRTRPIKAEDQFSFALRLEINPVKIKTDNCQFEVVLFDGEEKITSLQKKVLLKPYQEYVSSKINPIVQSVVQQFQSTITNERLMKQMSQGGFGLMKKMLVEEVKGMRKVRNALVEERENKRARVEVLDFQQELFRKENALLISEMLEQFGDIPEVKNFLNRWRKVTRRVSQRVSLRLNNSANAIRVNRRNQIVDIDEDLQADLLEDAIELADTLIQRFPEKKRELNNYQRRLSESLARYQ